MIIAFVIKGIGVTIPNAGLNFLSLVGQPTTPLIMIALGLYFEPQLKNIRLRFDRDIHQDGSGALYWMGLGYIVWFTGNLRTVVIVSAATPCGFNTLIFANLENMDREFAATIVSISLLIASSDPAVDSVWSVDDLIFKQKTKSPINRGFYII